MLGNTLNMLRPALMMLEPELAHDLTLQALKRGFVSKQPKPDAPELGASLFGTRIPNPAGIAAGFDKNAVAAAQLLRTGFGFVEVGTVTPLPQRGNAKPRVFRLPAARAVINRFGFNSDGHAAVRDRLSGLAKSDRSRLGANIGANKDSVDRVADYVAGVRAFGNVSGYLTVNISSPNTPGLRDLQAPDELRRLLTKVMSERDRLANEAGLRTPIVVKLAPDIAELDLAPIVNTLMDLDVDGIAVSNTTITRPGIDQDRDLHGTEAGGLSGRPIFDLSTAMLARVYRLTKGKVLLIGIGGVDSGERAVAKIRAGATLLQLYTGLIYRGLPLIDEIKATLLEATRAAGATSYTKLIGADSDKWEEVRNFDPASTNTTEPSNGTGELVNATGT